MMNFQTSTSYSGPIYGERLRSCVACGSPKIRRWASKSFNYSLGRSAESFTIDRCENCNTGFLNPPPHEQYLEEIYSYSGHGLTEPVNPDDVLNRESEFPNSTVDAERLVRIGSLLDKSGVSDALDVGSGMGFMTREMLRQGRKPVSINPGQYENAVFEVLNGYPPFVGMLDDYKVDKKFGLIVLSQVMEHMLSPAVVAKRLATMLAPGGVLALAVPNFGSAAVALLGTRENGCLWVPEHVNYFTTKGLRNLIEGAGLKALRQEQVTRVRPDAISRRVPVGKGFTKGLVELGVKPLAPALNAVGLGLHLNLYAQKPFNC